MSLRRAINILILLLTLSVGAFVALKHTIESIAAANAREVVARHSVTGDVYKKSSRLGEVVYNAYQKTTKGKSLPILLRLRPVLTNDLLPQFLKVKKGAIETIYINGYCDSAARTLIFILNEVGIPAEQLNIIAPVGGHSVVLVSSPSEQPFMIDPYFGVIANHLGRYLSPQAAKELSQQGVGAERIWRSLAGQPVADFYRSFDRAVFSLQGTPLVWSIDIDLNKESLQLGSVNGRSEDVSTAAAKRGWSPYWHYLGHRYDRAWERRIRVTQPTRVTLLLTETLNQKFLTTRRAPMSVAGKKIVYELDSGDELQFVDSRARRDLFSLRSYQDVDAIIFERIEL